ncbi:hypothetical protein [Rubrivirga marina]|uniref:Type 4 secretion system PilS N-terminal domain-containing protein n=1 Tax=Rubrivirga marina TaxID=1196024 RepID=A0A271IZY4_9BACT|nr:hypothetical protein [Rubrivirga marina]PAP76637.1 hypothetical protein BSZ37_09375 [Rubrivirga marina]
MGQQQLLLLVLGIVIVGLAVVIGIQAFSENKTNSTTDAMNNEIVRIASDIQTWSLKPQAFGGPVGESGFEEVTFSDLGYGLTTWDGDASAYSTLTAHYRIAAGSPDCVAVQAISNDGVTGGTSNGNASAALMSVRVTGADPDDIEYVGGEHVTC